MSVIKINVLFFFSREGMPHCWTNKSKTVKQAFFCQMMSDKYAQTLLAVRTPSWKREHWVQQNKNIWRASAIKALLMQDEYTSASAALARGWKTLIAPVSERRTSPGSSEEPVHFKWTAEMYSKASGRGMLAFSLKLKRRDSIQINSSGDREPHLLKQSV